MEALHAMRFWAKLIGMDPTIPADGWTEIYSKLQDNPQWRCGCPNQRRDPEWEEFLRWFHGQMGGDALDS